MSSPEQLRSSGERGIESLGETAGERSAEVAKTRERGAEQSPERQQEALDAALRDAHEASVSVERPAHEAGAQASATHVVRPAATRRARAKAYKDIVRHTQNELPPVSRAFSKVIHQPAVEKTSAAVGATVARPNAILFGALFAFLISGAVYVIAKHYGYGLSGFEAIGAFIIGWAVGMLVDVFRLALRRR